MPLPTGKPLSAQLFRGARGGAVAFVLPRHATWGKGCRCAEPEPLRQGGCCPLVSQKITEARLEHGGREGCLGVEGVGGALGVGEEGAGGVEGRGGSCRCEEP